MQLNLRLGAGCNEGDAFTQVVECARSGKQQRGLVHASCLVDDDAQVCAPLYIWRSDGAMRGFLLGNPFNDVIDAYGRPRVRTWNVLEFGHGDETIMPGFAICELDTVCGDSSLWVVARRERERHRQMLDQPGLAAHTSMFDPDRWEIARYSLWRDAASAATPHADCVQTYRVARCADSHLALN